MKPQVVRVADVLLIGPLMVWAGLELREERPALGPLLALLGASTVIYNARNYLLVREHGYRC